MIMYWTDIEASRREEEADTAIRVSQSDRNVVVRKLVNDLYSAGRTLGLTKAQALGYVNELFNAFPGEWAVYVIVGADGIITSIQNDATLPWLDTDVAGVTIRQRLINRLL